MPQRRSAIKELRKNHKRRMQNLDIKTDLKKTIKKFLASVQNKNKDEAQATLRLVFKKLDKAEKKKLFKKNTISRRKSKFNKLATSIT